MFGLLTPDQPSRASQDGHHLSENEQRRQRVSTNRSAGQRRRRERERRERELLQQQSTVGASTRVSMVILTYEH